MILWTQKSRTSLPGERVLHRIAALTLGFGLAAATAALALQRPDWAEGLAGGAVLGWLNFRWLQRGIRAMMLSALALAPAASPETEGTASAPKSTISTAGTYFTLLFRYGLVALGVYVIFV